MKKEIIHTFVKFGMVGVFATILHYGIYWVLQRFIEVNVAYSVAYFLAFRKFVMYKNKRHQRKTWMCPKLII